MVEINLTDEVEVNLPDEIEDASDGQRPPRRKATAFLETPVEWPGDLKINIRPVAGSPAVLLMVDLQRDDTNISIVSQLSADEADELADAFRSAASSIREHSE